MDTDTDRAIHILIVDTMDVISSNPSNLTFIDMKLQYNFLSTILIYDYLASNSIP